MLAFKFVLDLFFSAKIAAVLPVAAFGIKFSLFSTLVPLDCIVFTLDLKNGYYVHFIESVVLDS